MDIWEYKETGEVFQRFFCDFCGKEIIQKERRDYSNITSFVFDYHFDNECTEKVKLLCLKRVKNKFGYTLRMLNLKGETVADFSELVLKKFNDNVDRKEILEVRE